MQYKLCKLLVFNHIPSVKVVHYVASKECLKNKSMTNLKSMRAKNKDVEQGIYLYQRPVHTLAFILSCAAF